MRRDTISYIGFVLLNKLLDIQAASEHISPK